jgi:dehydratase
MQPLARLMQHRASRLAASVAVAAALGGVALVASSASAATASSTVKVTYKFQISADGESETTSGSTNISVTAPATVAPGGAVAISATAAAFKLDSSVDGVDIKNVENISVEVKAPTNSTFESCTLTGGSGLGTGTPTCTESGGIVTLSVPGPIPGGTVITPPVVTFNVKAGKKGSIVTKLAGTSYSSPGLKGTANVTIFGEPVTATAVGYPDPNKALSTTKIS